jgi:hypothetical protein
MRQHVLVVRHEAALVVGHLVGQAAGLAAVAAVGAAAGVGMADVALAAVGHAQRAVDEELEVQRWGGGARMARDLLQRQLARQHDLRQAASCRKRAFSGVRMSVWVLACSWMGAGRAPAGPCPG